MWVKWAKLQPSNVKFLQDSVCVKLSFFETQCMYRIFGSCDSKNLEYRRYAKLDNIMDLIERKCTVVNLLYSTM